MKANETLSILFLGTATAAIAQTGSQDHDAHHPAESQATPPAVTEDGPPPAGMQGGMPGMGMMTPEMMQMMQRMMGQGGMPGMMREMQAQGMPEGQMPMVGGMMMCPMMQMTGSSAGMQAMMRGDAMLYGTSQDDVEEMTPERVRTFLEERLEQHGNPRLKLGEVAEQDEGTIVAEILTVDDSLVQRLAVDRATGAMRQLP